jgi:uncharacterized membrane protein YeaQ/YmgE (transglycosylase-associated protein family)
MPGINLVEVLLDFFLWPGLWLSLGLGAACGVLFHIAFGGGPRRFFMDPLIGALGFALGQIASGVLRLAWISIGEVQIVPGILGAVLVLALSRFAFPVSNGA